MPQQSNSMRNEVKVKRLTDLVFHASNSDGVEGAKEVKLNPPQIDLSGESPVIFCSKDTLLGPRKTKENSLETSQHARHNKHYADRGNGDGVEGAKEVKPNPPQIDLSGESPVIFCSKDTLLGPRRRRKTPLRLRSTHENENSYFLEIRVSRQVMNLVEHQALECTRE
ncbi:hypothetical protein CDAR_478521 [Caerostris darwini]|uniref:Uncharacterized protein n=1 Tax=Caerostris darwini TaxID=1538125 RepID=A0AAV4QMG0_9ARAC|nr:hypothetical protein CDAR_478521 [Caerostris darwini]